MWIWRSHPGERLGMKAGPCVMLAISDNGIGMDRRRARASSNRSSHEGAGPGSGLGLSTVYSVVNQAGGQVDGLQPARLRNHLRGLPAARH